MLSTSQAANLSAKSPASTRQYNPPALRPVTHNCQPVAKHNTNATRHHTTKNSLSLNLKSQPQNSRCCLSLQKPPVLKSAGGVSASHTGVSAPAAALCVPLHDDMSVEQYLGEEGTHHVQRQQQQDKTHLGDFNPHPTPPPPSPPVTQPSPLPWAASVDHDALVLNLLCQHARVARL